MTITLVSINGNAINDGANFQAIISDDNPLQAQTAAQYIDRYQNWPVYSHKAFGKFKFSIVVVARAGSMANLMAWFDTSQTEPVVLVGSEGGVQYYRMVTPELVQSQGASAVKVILSTADPVWKAVTATTASAWNITASGQTTAITINGTRYTEPTISLAISSGAGWAYKRFVLVRNSLTTYPLTNYPVEVTGGGLNTSTLVSGGKMQADGDDWRLMVDGVEWPRWFDATVMNTSSTPLWTVLDFKPGIEPTLGAAIASSGAVGEITFAKNSANAAYLKALPPSGMLLIDNEVFTYTSKNETARKIGGVTRAAKGTSMAAHSLGATCYWIEHDIWMMYGNASATAPVQDDSRKPIFALTSTQINRVYTEFFDAAGLRAGSWKLSVTASSGKLSRITTGDSAGEADPATCLGMEINPWQKSGKWQGETATILATLTEPGGISTITCSGQKYRGGTSWPGIAALQRSSNGSTWNTLWNETTPASAESWTAFSRGSTSLSNNRFGRFAFSGSIKGAASERVNFEIAAVTVVPTSAGQPSITLGAETGQNWIDFLLENTTSGDSFEVRFPMTGSTALVIDCENHTITAGGESIYGAIGGLAGKRFWMRLLRGANTLRITGSVGTMTATISYRERLL